MNKVFYVLLFCLFFESTSFALDKTTQSKVKYKSAKRIDFQSLLIEGEKKKAQFSVVTGNMGEVDLGLLKVRENFHDFMKDDIREEVQL